MVNNPSCGPDFARALRRPEKEAAPHRGRGRSKPEANAYLPAVPSWVEMFENVVFSWPPRVFTVAMIATEIPAAIRPYSMAVAPLSSRRKRLNTDMLLSQGDRRFCGRHRRVMPDKSQG